MNESLRNFAERLIKNIDDSFGGSSQVPMWVYGMAIAGQCNNGKFCNLTHKDWVELADCATDVIYDSADHLDWELIKCGLVDGLVKSKERNGGDFAVIADVISATLTKSQ